jgi:hypothetical protein
MTGGRPAKTNREKEKTEGMASHGEIEESN